MQLVRLFRLCLHLLEGLATCALLFPWLDARQRMQRIQRWSARLLRICGMRVALLRTASAAGDRRALIVANHVSWLDIFVINSVDPSRFVAKSDIRDWPLIGWLCRKAGTIFIARGRVRDVRKIFESLVASLHDGERVAFFPEGTTAAQGNVLPFHANLFEAAIDAGVAVQPYALRYVDARGGLHEAADFVGDMTFAQSVIAILRAGEMTVELIELPPIATAGAHRRELADATRRDIIAALERRSVQPGC
jgi:1-acyl-sn-glycerol-3-phosphate acyltransferase